MGTPTQAHSRRALDEAVLAALARRALADGTFRELRHRSGLSQGGAGAIVGVTHGAIGHYEAGRRKPRGEIAVRLGRLVRRLAAVHGEQVA